MSQTWPSSKRLFVVGAVRLLAVAVTVAVAGLALGWLGSRANITCGPHGMVGVELAGTEPRSAEALLGCQSSEVRSALGWDGVFIASYVAVLTVGVLFAGGVLTPRTKGGYRLQRLRRARWMVLGLLVGGALLDLVENAALWRGLHGPDGNLSERPWAAWTAATAGWTKFVFLTLVAGYVLFGLIGWLAKPALSLAEPAPFDPSVEPSGTAELGICLSGGGVRAATYGLGVLQVLDCDGLYGKARWLSAVSGGSYMAGAWTIARHEPSTASNPPLPWADPAARDAGSAGAPEVTHLRHHLNYLSARQGGLVGALATIVVGVAVNAATLFGVVWLMSRPLGWLTGSWLITDAAASSGTISYRLEPRLWGPVLTWAAVAVLLLLVWVLLTRVASLGLAFARREVRAVVFSASVAAAAATALLGVVLIAAPAAIAALPELLRDHARLLRLVQTMTAGGIVAATIAVARKPLSKVAPRLGGLLVVLLAVLVGSEVGAHAATKGASDDFALWLVVLAAFSVWYYVADPDWWSLQPYYRARLREAYATGRTTSDGGTVTVDSLSSADEPDLEAFAATKPELLVCTTMNVTGTPTRVGVPAYSFTFSPTRVRFHAPGPNDGESNDYSVDTASYAKVFRRWDTPKLTAMTAVGMSGAAVSSAMGRFNRGSTNALLTLANIRLGMWMPNPRVVATAGSLPERPGYPRRRISYLLKELLHIYDSEDLYVYVTDGGHWENLGLVELLRRRCTEIICVYASGSDAAHFGTIAQAISLAAEECGVTVELPFEPLRADVTNGSITRTTNRDCAMGLITYPSGRTGEPKASQGLLWYAKASLTPDTSARLSAYKEQHAIFPSDPTTDQWFDTEKFECYRLLGQHTARHLTTLRINAARSANHNPNLVPGYAPTEDERRLINEKFNDDTRAWLADHIPGSTAAGPAG